VAAVQIISNPDGRLWASTEAYAVWRYADGKWTNVQAWPAKKRWHRRTAWILTMDPGPGGYESMRHRRRSFRTCPTPRAAVHLAAVGPASVAEPPTTVALPSSTNRQFLDRPAL